MNLLLNTLPGRTWNRLGMNEVRVSLEGDFESVVPQADWNPEEVLWQPQAQRESSRMRLGSGEDLRTLTREAPLSMVETAPGAVMETPITLTYAYEEGAQAVSRLVLHAGKNSRLSAVIVMKTPAPDSTGTVALQTEVLAEEGASVRLYVAQLLGSGCVCLRDISGVCEENAAVSLTNLELGGSKVYAGSLMDLQGKGSTFTADIAYHVLKDQLLDMNYVALHHGAQTESLMEVNGTLEEHGRKLFRGTIDFQQGCKGAKGTENEHVLLLGEDMVNQTIPLILCKEEDVEGNHGATIGQLDEKVLFYLASRGISEKVAQKMMARSRVEAVCSRIPVEAVQELAREFEEKRTHDDEQSV